MVTAKQIADWAATSLAQRELPRLVRRLVHATATTTQISMPAGDSTSSPGLDGELYSDQGNAWVPKGHSCWEASCRSDVTTKANEDYEKRVKQIAEGDRQTRIFVFITARKWPQKEKWAAEKRAEGQWLDVRAYNADDLEQWLEQSPAVALAFGEELGLVGPGITSLEKYFRTWSSQSSPHITSAAILVGRVEQAQDFVAKCHAAIEQISTQPISIRGDSVEEAVAFVAAALLEDKELVDRSVVVTDEAGWHYVEKNTDIQIAIASEPELAKSPTMRNGLILIVPYASGDMAKQFAGVAGRLTDPVIALDRARHDEFEKALKGIGVDENDSRRLSALCGRSWSIFRRQHANNPGIRRPAWLDHPAAQALATLCLIGGWLSDNEVDKEIVARIAGRPYDDFERDLITLERLDDSPVVRIGAVWKAKSALELLSLFGDRITEVEIERFFAEAKSILSKPDPVLELEKDKRYAASIYGKVRPTSELLFKALCDTLIKLAVRGPDVEALSVKQIDGRVAKLIRELLHGADAQRWLSLSSALPALAEASPDVFLSAIEDSLNRSDEPILQLFKETENTDSFGGRCWHCGLLWALETLGWAPQRLTRVSLFLARLSDVEITGNWGNTPFNSLIDFYRSWFPQTGATVGQRIDALDVLIEREPKAAARLLDALTGSGHDVAHHNARPKWRDDDAGAGYGVTHAERHQMMVAAADRQLQLADKNAEQIAALIEKYTDFDDARRQMILNLIQNVQGESDEDKEIVRGALRHIIHWHRNYGDQDKVDALLAPLEFAYNELQPSDLIICYAWLFKEGWIDLPVRHRDGDIAGRQDMAAKIRMDAMKEIFSAEGWSGLVRFAEHTSGGWLIGMHHVDAGASFDEAIEWVIISAGDLQRGAQMTNIAGGILNAAIRSGGHNVIQNFLAAAERHGRDLDWKVRLLTYAPEEKGTWDIVDTLGVDAREKYWRLCNGNVWVRDDPQLMQYALTQLLAVGRPRTALQACGTAFESIDPELLMQILEGLANGIEPDAEIPRPYYFQQAVDRLEESDVIDRMRLAQLEFALINGLGFGRERHAASLYTVLMSQPESFVELLCLSFKPKNDEEEEITEGGQAAASNAWHILRACKRQPGTLKDGTITKESVRAFIEKSRELAQAKDRIEVCDIQLGEILARGEVGADGVFPCEQVRDVMERSDGDDMLRGFYPGCITKRGTTSRGVYDGGTQERELAEEYRANAKALEIMHPRLSATLENLARSYDRQGLREDMDARFRLESG